MLPSAMWSDLLTSPGRCRRQRRRRRNAIRFQQAGMRAQIATHRIGRRNPTVSASFKFLLRKADELPAGKRSSHENVSAPASPRDPRRREFVRAGLTVNASANADPPRRIYTLSAGNCAIERAVIEFAARSGGGAAALLLPKVSTRRSAPAPALVAGMSEMRGLPAYRSPIARCDSATVVNRLCAARGDHLSTSRALRR